MSVTYQCPGCGNEVLIPNPVHEFMEIEMRHVGCPNEDEHDDGEPLVMWSQ